MSGPDELPFDPYHEWLGIPPAEQPPNYYRLLGLSLYEDNPAAILNAADRQVAYLRTLAVGPRAFYAQHLLNYVAEVAGTLMDAERKAAYDAWLPRSGTLKPPTISVPAAPPVAPARAPLVPYVVPLPAAATPWKAYSSPASGRRRWRATRQPRSAAGAMLQWLIGGIAGIAIAVVLLYVVFDLDPLAVMERLERAGAGSQRRDSP